MIFESTLGRAVAVAACVAWLLGAGAAAATTIELNLLYVHGVKGCPDARQNAQGSFADVGAAMAAALPGRIASWEAAHPGFSVVVNQAYANLYTATPSGIHPSDSPDPLNMDDWEVGDPGCSTTQQGDPCTTAFEWRYRLVQEINRLFPPPAGNLILIGHSTGARTAMEVAANVGPAGVGTYDWGVQDRLAGVVTVHGMLDAIGSSKYNVVGFTSFETGCKLGDPILGFGSSCAVGNGWCEYAGRVDGFPAADWVARNRRALMLTAWGSCSPSAWTGRSDGSLPYDAQGSPWAVGLDMTPAPGQTWRPAHGQLYGSFCHSALVSSGDANHAAARGAAVQRILDWIFVAAPRVAASGSNATPSIGYNQYSATYTMGSSCPAGEVDDALTQGTVGAGIDLVGVCKHPGYFDGDDHAIDASEFSVTDGPTCDGSYRWKQAHDSNNNHAATFWWKTRSLPGDGPDLVGHLLAGIPTPPPDTCGDGALDAGEECDDGNRADGDCCSASCTFEPYGSTCAADGNDCTDDVCDGAGLCGVNNTEPCEDGDLCTDGDICADGACVPGPPAVCQACAACDSALGCVAQPRAGCQTSPSSALTIRDSWPDRGDRFSWQWKKGDVPALAAFGNPAGSDDYTLCLYDESQNPVQTLLGVTIPAAGTCGAHPCWRSAGRGLKYKDGERRAGGIDTIRLLPGAGGRARIVVKGKGEKLSAGDTGLVSSPFGLPVRVQLRSAAGGCWESSYDSAIRNEPPLFKARK